MKSNTALSILLLAIVMMLGFADAQLTPRWFVNIQRHFSYFPEFFWIPGLSQFWALAFPTYIWLGILGFFGRYEQVVKFYTELITIYYPMSGLYTLD
eukprot:403370914